METADIYSYISQFKDDNIFAVAELLRRGEDTGKIFEVTQITEFFIKSIKKITDMEKRLSESRDDTEVFRQAKKMGFSDKYIGRLWNMSETEVYGIRKRENIFPVYKMVDTCHTNAYIPYFYSSYTGENKSVLTGRKKIIVLGAGPIRIGQGS